MDIHCCEAEKVVTIKCLKVLDLASKQPCAMPVLAGDINISVSVVLFKVLTVAVEQNLNQFFGAEMFYFQKFSSQGFCFIMWL